MPLVTVTEILTDARRRKYGVPCFLGGNLEMVLGAVRAAEELNAPLILCFNEAITPDISIEIGMALLVLAAKSARVPVATTLDHGASFESCVRAAFAGSSSVMFDGSYLRYEENVRLTKKVREFATPLAVSLEGELGAIGGSVLEYKQHSGDTQQFTIPEQAVEFVEQTGVDIFALSFGNVHGRYQGDNRLDLDLVRQIHGMIEIPLVMHGGSGLPDEMYPAIIAAGISKINYYTDIARRGGRFTASLCVQHGEEIIEHMLIQERIRFYFEESRRVLSLFGAAGKV